MRLTAIWSRLLMALFLAGALPALGQLSPAPPDPLAQIRSAAQGNTPACSATGESLCEQVAPKIIENAMGESPLADNLHRLALEAGGRASSATAAARAVAWAVASFRQAGAAVRTEKYVGQSGGAADQENVAAEIRGREKPDEWVLLGAHLGSGDAALDNDCNAAMVIEAARDILRTGIHPRRSIRFVLFAGGLQENSGAWAYVRAHGRELDRASAAIIFGAGCSRVTGFLLNGRGDIEPGVRDSMKPIASWGADHFGMETPLGNDNFDFLAEGVPTLTADRQVNKAGSDSRIAPEANGNARPGIDNIDNIDIGELKRSAAIAAVTAFGIAERAAPLGARQTRGEIDTLLKKSGLEQPMRREGLWPSWESGERGRSQ